MVGGFSERDAAFALMNLDAEVVGQEAKVTRAEDLLHLSLELCDVDVATPCYH